MAASSSSTHARRCGSHGNHDTQSTLHDEAPLPIILREVPGEFLPALGEYEAVGDIRRKLAEMLKTGRAQAHADGNHEHAAENAYSGSGILGKERRSTKGRPWRKLAEDDSCPPVVQLFMDRCIRSSCHRAQQPGPGPAPSLPSSGVAEEVPPASSSFSNSSGLASASGPSPAGPSRPAAVAKLELEAMDDSWLFCRTSAPDEAFLFSRSSERIGRGGGGRETTTNRAATSCGPTRTRSIPDRRSYRDPLSRRRKENADNSCSLGENYKRSSSAGGEQVHRQRASALAARELQSVVVGAPTLWMRECLPPYRLLMEGRTLPCSELASSVAYLSDLCDEYPEAFFPRLVTVAETFRLMGDVLKWSRSDRRAASASRKGLRGGATPKIGKLLDNFPAERVAECCAFVWPRLKKQLDLQNPREKAHKAARKGARRAQSEQDVPAGVGDEQHLEKSQQQQRHDHEDAGSQNFSGNQRRNRLAYDIGELVRYCRSGSGEPLSPLFLSTDTGNKGSEKFPRSGEVLTDRECVAFYILSQSWTGGTQQGPPDCNKEKDSCTSRFPPSPFIYFSQRENTLASRTLYFLKKTNAKWRAEVGGAAGSLPLNALCSGPLDYWRRFLAVIWRTELVAHCYRDLLRGTNDREAEAIAADDSLRCEKIFAYFWSLLDATMLRLGSEFGNFLIGVLLRCMVPDTSEHFHAETATRMLRLRNGVAGVDIDEDADGELGGPSLSKEVGAASTTPFDRGLPLPHKKRKGPRMKEVLPAGSRLTGIWGPAHRDDILHRRGILMRPTPWLPGGSKADYAAEKKARKRCGDLSGGRHILQVTRRVSKKGSGSPSAASLATENGIKIEHSFELRMSDLHFPLLLLPAYREAFLHLFAKLLNLRTLHYKTLCSQLMAIPGGDEICRLLIFGGHDSTTPLETETESQNFKSTQMTRAEGSKNCSTVAPVVPAVLTRLRTYFDMSPRVWMEDLDYECQKAVQKLPHESQRRALLNAAAAVKTKQKAEGAKLLSMAVSWYHSASGPECPISLAPLPDLECPATMNGKDWYERDCLATCLRQDSDEDGNKLLRDVATRLQLPHWVRRREVGLGTSWPPLNAVEKLKPEEVLRDFYVVAPSIDRMTTPGTQPGEMDGFLRDLFRTALPLSGVADTTTTTASGNSLSDLDICFAFFPCLCLKTSYSLSDDVPFNRVQEQTTTSAAYEHLVAYERVRAIATSKEEARILVMFAVAQAGEALRPLFSTWGTGKDRNGAGCEVCGSVVAERRRETETRNNDNPPVRCIRPPAGQNRLRFYTDDPHGRPSCGRESCSQKMMLISEARHFLSRPSMYLDLAAAVSETTTTGSAAATTAGATGAAPLRQKAKKEAGRTRMLQKHMKRNIFFLQKERKRMQRRKQKKEDAGAPPPSRGATTSDATATTENHQDEAEAPQLHQQRSDDQLEHQQAAPDGDSAGAGEDAGADGGGKSASRSRGGGKGQQGKGK